MAHWLQMHSSIEHVYAYTVPVRNSVMWIVEGSPCVTVISARLVALGIHSRLDSNVFQPKMALRQETSSQNIHGRLRVDSRFKHEQMTILSPFLAAFGIGVRIHWTFMVRSSVHCSCVKNTLPSSIPSFRKFSLVWVLHPFSL